MTGNAERRPVDRGDAPEDDPTKITKKILAGSDDWLSEYPEEIRELIRMDKRRRAASLRLPPTASGKRDPIDLINRDAPEAA
jgi:hypothetical protein